MQTNSVTTRENLEKNLHLHEIINQGKAVEIPWERFQSEDFGILPLG